MWKLPKPDLLATLQDIPKLVSASQRRRDSNMHLDINNDKAELESLYRLYDDNAGVLSETDCGILSEEKRNNILECYKHTYYSEPNDLNYIRLALIKGISHCPLCGFGEITTLDHVLPKSKYKTLATCRLNLVPVCYQCNSLKNDTLNFPHPYYSNYIGEFLICNAVWDENIPLFTFKFQVNAGNIGVDLAEKVENQIDALQLTYRWNREICSFLFEEQCAVRGRNDEELNANMQLFYANQKEFMGENHWKTVVLKALINCPDFNSSNWTAFIEGVSSNLNDCRI